MSMRSFDDICEKMIPADENSRKEIFDERQKIIRLRLGIEALAIFASAALVCCGSMDFVNKWAESITCPLLAIGVLSMLWFLIRCTAKGCMVVVSGKQVQKSSAILTIVAAALNLPRYVADLCKGASFIKDNMLTNELLFMVCFILIMICGIFSLCVIYRENKMNESEGSR